MSTIIKGSTKRGTNLINSARTYDGYTLGDVYSNYSRAKEEAYEWCREKYLKTPASRDFWIVSHNTFSFTVRWFGYYENERALFIETSQNSYIVLLDK